MKAIPALNFGSATLRYSSLEVLAVERHSGRGWARRLAAGRINNSQPANGRRRLGTFRQPHRSKLQAAGEVLVLHAAADAGPNRSCSSWALSLVLLVFLSIFLHHVDEQRAIENANALYRSRTDGAHHSYRIFDWTVVASIAFVHY